MYFQTDQIGQCKHIVRMYIEKQAQSYVSTHTCLAKNIVSSLLSCTTEPAGSSPARHLKRKISPWQGLQKRSSHRYVTVMAAARFNDSEGNDTNVVMIRMMLRENVRWTLNV